MMYTKITTSSIKKEKEKKKRKKKRIDSNDWVKPNPSKNILGLTYSTGLDPIQNGLASRPLKISLIVQRFRYFLFFFFFLEKREDS